MNPKLGNSAFGGVPLNRELSLVGRLPAAGFPVELRVAAVSGACAWGYHGVDRWAVAADGGITPRLCQAAAAALGPGLGAWLAHPGHEYRAACRCRLAGTEVTFVARSAASAA